jgi:transketolase
VVNFLGSAVAEVLVEEYPVPMSRVGIQDEFGEVGTEEYLLHRYGLNAEKIAEAAKATIKKKR